MAKRRRGTARQPEVTRATLAAVQRRGAPPRRRTPPSARNRTPLIVGGAVAALAGLAVLAYALGWFGGSPAGPGSGAGACVIPAAGRALGPPEATPLADPPATTISDGTRINMETEKGTIVIELFCGSAPVAAQNFVNLATAGFYDGVGFHRLVPGFVIQGGDPQGTGFGGPGYTIPDEDVVGTYGRGIVAMARSSQPNSQSSQFFIVLDDGARDDLEASNQYAIFGKVISGMEVVDDIADEPTGGDSGDSAITPVKMIRVTVQQVPAS